MYNDHPCDPQLVAVVDRWSLFRGHFIKFIKVQNGAPLYTSCCYSEMVVSSGLTVVKNVAVVVKIEHK